jgi:hypothetical protein
MNNLDPKKYVEAQRNFNVVPMARVATTYEKEL